MRTFLASLSIVLLIAGCDTATEAFPSSVRPGVVYLDVRGNARVVIDGVRVADADPFVGEVSSERPVVRAGVPFDVTVATHTGSDPCWDAAPSDVSVAGPTATVSVFDEVFERPCSLEGTMTPRTDEVVFAAPGAAEVVIRGVRGDMGVLEPSPYELRFDVVVE